jgi:hypothetical protein
VSTEKADQRGALTKHILAVNQTRWERLLWISDCLVPQDEQGGREKEVMAKRWGQGTDEHCVLVRGQVKMYSFLGFETDGDISLERLEPRHGRKIQKLGGIVVGRGSVPCLPALQ